MRSNTRSADSGVSRSSMPNTVANAWSSQMPRRRAAEQMIVRGERVPDPACVLLDRRAVPARDAEVLEPHALAVEHPEHVVIGRDEQRRRIRERRVVGEPLRIGVPVRADDRQVLDRRVEASREVARRRVGGKQPVGMEIERNPGHGGQPCEVMGERCAHAVPEQRDDVARDGRAERRVSRRGRAEHGCEIEEAGGDPRGIVARGRDDARERRRPSDRRRRSRCPARRCRSHSGSTRRRRARDGGTGRRPRCGRAPCRAGAAAASASRPSRSAACGAAARDCGSATISCAQYAARSMPGGAASVGTISSVIWRSTSVASGGSDDACQMVSWPARKPR